MKKLLITLGDSFTYGEGLEYYVWLEKYNTSYNIYKDIQDNNFPIKNYLDEYLKYGPIVFDFNSAIF
jgi:hypothetical protein